MFSKKEVNRALTWMFCLYDIADVEIMGTDFDTVPEDHPHYRIMRSDIVDHTILPAMATAKTRSN